MNTNEVIYDGFYFRINPEDKTATLSLVLLTVPLQSVTHSSL